MASFQTDEDSDKRSDEGNYIQREQFKYVLSKDGGRSWDKAVHVAGEPGRAACWNSLYLLRDGRIMALTTISGRIFFKQGSLGH